MKKRDEFNYRATTTFIVTLFIAVIAVSGVILYASPPGRIAHWTNWRFGGLTKDGWSMVHTTFAFFFVIAAGFHLYFNWKILMSYLRTKFQTGIRLKRELLSASLFTTVFLAGSVVGLPPFSSIMALGEVLKESWEESNQPPPIPHAELMTLEEFSGKMDIALEEALRQLKNKGITVADGAQQMGEIAKENDLSPSELFEAMAVKSPPSPVSDDTHGLGYGKKTIAEVCAQLGVPLESGKANLASRGISLEGDESLRDIASELGVQPVEIVNLIKESRQK